jgi:hypothetical protein
MIDPHAIQFALALNLLQEAGDILLAISREKRLAGDFAGANVAIRFCEQIIQCAAPQVGTGLATHCKKMAGEI